MLGSGYYLIAALALVYLQPSAALNSTLANAVCNLLEDGVMIYSGEECDQYYTCSSGVATLSTCSGGYYFSKDQQACLPSSSVICGASGANPCATAQNGVFLAVPNSCTDFYYCFNGVASQSSCPNGLNFDPVDQSCNYTVNYPCSSTNGAGGDSVTIDLCAFIPSGVYFGSSTSCQAWQQCSNGALTVGNCPSPYYFNVLTATCDYQSDVSCRQETNDPNTGTNPGYLAGTTCSTNGLVVSDNSTCVGYYMCNNNVYSYGQCTNGLYYNPPTQTCVNRLNAINNCNRCEDTSLEFVNLYQDNCVGYGYCNNGRVASTGTCPEGYFDEVDQACVVESEPQYAVCNDSLGGSSTTASSSTSSDSSSSDSSSESSTSSTDSSSSSSSTASSSSSSSSSSESTSTTEPTTTTTLA